MAGSLTFNQRIRVRISLGTPLLLLSTNGRSSDFQSENTGSIPVKSASYLYLYRLVVRSSGFQPEGAGSIPARDTKVKMLPSTNG